MAKIDHDSGEVLAYTLGTREDKVFLEKNCFLPLASLVFILTSGRHTPAIFRQKRIESLRFSKEDRKETSDPSDSAQTVEEKIDLFLEICPDA